MPGRLAVQRVNWLLLIVPAICLCTLARVDYLGLEAALMTLALLAAWALRRRFIWTGRPPSWCYPLRRLSRRPVLACVLPAMISVVLRLALLPWIPKPYPVIADEFSHLFLAKTFLLERLANPPHPLWQHFESLHILSQPTFSSMYMAGQACFLAAGAYLFGDPFAGVLLSTALFCGALVWFLRAYVPPGWAFYGGLLAAIRFGTASYWNNSYWGGSAGAFGGALVLGAYPRLIATGALLPTLLFATGVVVLANTRPYEGAAIVGVLALGLGWRLATKAARFSRSKLVQSATVAGVLLSFSGWAMTRHWKAVTGHPLTLPYQINQATYGWPMTLPWFPVREIQYRHPEFDLYRRFELGEHQMITHAAKIPIGILVKISYLWRFYFGITLSATLLFATNIVRARRSRTVWIAGGVVTLLVMTEQSGFPHYVSPAAPAILLLVVQGFRYWSHYRGGKAEWGRALPVVALPVLCTVLMVRADGLFAGTGPEYISWCCTDTGRHGRESLVRKLEREPGNQLVIVSYDLATYDTYDWVYNEPDIDSSKLVFARDMGPAKNLELLNYFPDRHLWRVYVKNGQAATVQDCGVGEVQHSTSTTQTQTGPS